MKNIIPQLVVSLSILFTQSVLASEADLALLKASTDGDAPQIILALSEANPNIRDQDGRTPLMLAAKAGDFESVKHLLWAGADARSKDNQGKTAREFLDLKGEAFAPLSLIIRCYAFCQEYARPGGETVSIPHLALVNDNWVDPSHPRLKPHYHINEKELNGRAGHDDDGNGFIDDVYGWNVADDIPLRAPNLGIDGTPATREHMKQLMADYKTALGDPRFRKRMRNRYTNPLVHQIGFNTLLDAAFKTGDPAEDSPPLDLNDFIYAHMLNKASHGTHVAGIITEHSDGKALIHSLDWGMVTSESAGLFKNFDELAAIALTSDSFPKFAREVINRHRAEGLKKAHRVSDYIRSTGAGIGNMSWEKPASVSRNQAEEVRRIYRIFGKSPATINQKYTGEDGLIVENLELEFAIANAAVYALCFYENPNVAIFVSANNSNTDNDVTLSAPAYLSRFFPNVVTVASVGPNGERSKFSCYGIRSVQVAAIGENVVSSILADLEAPMDGTSMAAPTVAGIAAAIRKDHPHLHARDIRRIIETSARRTPALAKYVSTSGIVDPVAAQKIAATWNGNNLAMRVEEARAAKIPGRDGPTIRVPELTVTPAPAPPPPPVNKPAPPSTPKVISRITNVSGSGNDWRVTMSTGVPLLDQRHSGVVPWPEQWYQDAVKAGLRITSIAGDASGWNVVMSGGPRVTQRLVGFEMNQSQIATNMNAGFRITSLAGYKDHWIIVMDSGTGYGNQRYTLPTPLTDGREQWIKQRWDEGLRITAVAGDDDPNDDKDGYLFVMSANSGLQDQVFSRPGPWPTQWINDNMARGFRVTATAGTGNRRIVVMSKGTKLDKQVFSPGGVFPNDWIMGNWK